MVGEGGTGLTARAVGVVLALAGAAAVGGDAGARSAVSSSFGPVAQAPQFVPDEVVVQFEQQPSRTDLRQMVVDVEALEATPLSLPGLFVMELEAKATVEDAVDELNGRTDVRYAEPNYVNRIAATPNDPSYPLLWGLDQASDADMDAPEAWNHQTGARSVVVGVIDSGVAYQHPDLAPNIWMNNDPAADGVDQDGNGKVDDTFGWDFVDEDNTPTDYNGHGTHVAGTIGAKGNNLLGVTGVNWDVSIMPLRAGDSDGSLTNVDVMQAIQYGCAEGVDIFNGSFGSAFVSTMIRDAVLACPNALFVFAAGNENKNLEGSGSSSDAFPCELHRAPTNAANVLCVAATKTDDTRASFSNYGPSAVHLAAPGQDILSTWPAYQAIDGTDGFDDIADALFDLRWGDRTTAAPSDAIWGRTTAFKSSGTHSLTDSPSGPYAPGSFTTIRRLGPFNLAGHTGCRVFYDILLDTEFLHDPFLVLAGTAIGTPTDLGGWWGSSGGMFIPLDTDLSTFDGEPIVYVRLALESDGAFELDGVYLDDLLVGCLNPAGAAYETIDGTSMASPHVTGVAALALAHDPSLGVAPLKARIIGAVDVLPALSGLVSTSGRLNACRAIPGCVPTSPPPPTPPAPPPPPPPPPTPPAPPPPPRTPAVARCVVPNVKGKTVPKARAALKAKRCAAGKIKRAFSRKVKKGRVIAQGRRPGTRHPRNTKVGLTVSKGAKKK